MEMDQTLYDSARETFVIVTVCIAVIWTMIVLWNYHKFLNVMESIMIQKRYPQIIKHQVWLMIVILLIAGPLIALDFSHLARFSASTQLIITRINHAVYPWFTFPFFTFIAWRFWHCFYGLQYSSSQEDETWKYHLNPALVKTKDFWLRNWTKFGSFKYTKKIIYRIVIIGVILDVVLLQLCIGTDAIYFAMFIELSFHSIPVTMILILWWKLPEYVDHFYIRDEIRYTVWVLLGIIGLVAVFFTISMMFGYLELGLIGTVFITQQMVGIVAMIMLRWSRNKTIQEKKLINDNSTDFDVSGLLLNPITFRVTLNLFLTDYMYRSI